MVRGIEGYRCKRFCTVATEAAYTPLGFGRGWPADLLVTTRMLKSGKAQ